MHSNFAGETDRWGSKSEMIALPIISWIIYLLVTVLEQFPQIWNTGVRVTEENKERIYRTLKNMLNTIKLITVAAFTYLSINTSLALRLPKWFSIVFLLLVFGNILFGL